MITPLSTHENDVASAFASDEDCRKAFLFLSTKLTPTSLVGLTALALEGKSTYEILKTLDAEIQKLHTHFDITEQGTMVFALTVEYAVRQAKKESK